MKIMNSIRRVFFWLAIAFTSLWLYNVTIAQTIPIEFADHETMRMYYDAVGLTTLITIVLSLLSTIDLKKTVFRNAMVVIATLCVLGFFFLSILSATFANDYGSFDEEYILYRNKKDTSITIREQAGWGNVRRIVKLEPWLHYWNKVTKVELYKIDTNEWISVYDKYR